MSQLPPEYDDIQPQNYDPTFTADISTKMRVPDRIIPLNGYRADPLNAYNDDFNTDEQIKNQKRAASMSVPDKIVMGDIENGRPLPDLHQDTLMDDMKYTYVGLTTPPRVLTLEERPFLMTEVHESMKEADEREAELDLYESEVLSTPSPRRYNDSLAMEARMAAPGNNSLLIADEDDDDNMVIMHRQIAKISRHVLLLEEENAKRSQREVVLYPVVLGYILFRVAAWFLRRL